MGNFLQKSRHGTVFYFRRRIPPDLQAVAGLTQVFVSLRTKDRPEAIKVARWMAVRCDQLFAMMRNMTDDDRFNADKNPALRNLIQSRLRQGLAEEKVEELEAHAAKQSEQQAKTIQDLKQIHSESLAIVVKSIVGSPGNTTLAVDPDSTTDARAVTIEQGVKRMFDTLKITPKSRKRYRSVFDHFTPFVGKDTRIASVTQSRFAEYSKHVISNPDWADKTKSLYVTTAGRLFTWAKGNLDNAPNISGATLKPTRSTPAHLDRAAFTLNEIGVLFRHVAPFKQSEPHRFWVTVAVAFLGCRLQEIAQADLNADIKQDAATGAWYLSVNENVGPGGHAKSVKTLAGWRTIPIHSALVRHGFIDYLETEKGAGARTPFERPWTPLKQDRPNSFDFAHGPIKWGSRTLARLNRTKVLSNPTASYFHSLRHSFISHLAKAGIPEEMRAAIAGQEYGGINSGVYAKLQNDVAGKVEIIEKHFDAYVDLLDAALASLKGGHKFDQPVA